MPNTTTYKRCPICGVVKPRDEFYRRDWFDSRQQRRLVRISSFCIPCEREYQRQRQRHRYRTDPSYRERKLRRAAQACQRQREENELARQWRGHAARSHLATLRTAGWSPRRVAAALGVHPDTVYRWARATQVPSEVKLAALRRLAEAILALTAPASEVTAGG